VDMPDRGMIHMLSGMKKDGVKFHHAIQNDAEFKPYGLFISGVFYLIFSFVLMVSFFFFLAVLGFELSALSLLDKCSST
jgi:hypothetical protein